MGDNGTSTDGVSRLSEKLGGHRVIRGIGRKCFRCGRQFGEGDTLIVSIDKKSNGEWNSPYGGCPDCNKRSIAPEAEESQFDQYVVEIGVKKEPYGLVLDGTSIEILDHSSGTDTD